MKFPDWLAVLGDQSYRDKNCPKESIEQITFINRLRTQYPDTLGRVVVHVKNEGKRTQGQVMFDKASGMTTGASDIIIPGAPALVIEIKRRDHTMSRWKDGQIEYLDAAQRNGAMVFVALGADAAMEAVKCYITKTTGNG